MTEPKPDGYAPVIVFGLVLAAASIDVINRYLGPAGMAVYALGVVGLTLAAYRYRRLFDRILAERHASVLIVLTVIIVGVVSLVMYPIANSGCFGGGSDADDALIVAATELMAGRFPFHPPTYLGNPIAPMPGSVMLAVPFVFLNIFALQNVFWLGVFAAILRFELKSSRTTLALLWMMLLVSPAIMQNVATGTDRTSNTIYIITAMWIMLRTIPLPAAPLWQKLCGAVLLGIGLSSRSNFIFVAPLIASVLVQNAGWRKAAKYLFVTALTALAVTAPFWLYDPAGFTPFHNQSAKVVIFESILPSATIVVPASGMALALGLALRRLSSDGVAFFFSCGITQLFSVFLLSTLSTIHSGQLDLYLGHVSYGVFFLFFVVMAAAIWLRQHDCNSRTDAPDSV